MPMKSKKSKYTAAHTDNVKHGMGDFYGQGKRNPIGKVRSGTVGMEPVSKKKMGKPPRSLA